VQQTRLGANLLVTAWLGAHAYIGALEGSVMGGSACSASDAMHVLTNGSTAEPLFTRLTRGQRSACDETDGFDQ
jgi:hypothetical protein